MILFEPNIVIIDDKRSEISGILSYYWEKGIGCRYYNAGPANDSYPTVPFSDVNIIFLDIYFTDNTTEYDAELCTSWIQSIIQEKHFYILVIWSKEVEHKNEILDLLAKSNRSPFVCLVKSKTEYTSSDGFDFEKLNSEIEGEINRLPALTELGIWKRKVKAASNKVIGHLSIESNPVSFTNKLKKIIISHGGISLLTSESATQKRGVLFDSLDNILISNTKDSIIYPDIDEFNKTVLYSLTESQSVGIDRELNSWFHFKLNNPSGSTERLESGSMYNFKTDSIWESIYSIKYDKKIINLLSKQVSSNVKFISIAVLLTRPCDLDQDKYGNNIKLLSGVKIVNPIRKSENRQEFIIGSSKPDSVIIFDNLYLNSEEKDITIIFDLRYSFSVPINILREQFSKTKVFSKEVISEIQVEYSSYSSRLGYTKIN